MNVLELEGLPCLQYVCKVPTDVGLRSGGGLASVKYTRGDVSVGRTVVGGSKLKD